MHAIPEDWYRDYLSNDAAHKHTHIGRMNHDITPLLERSVEPSYWSPTPTQKTYLLA
jgi:hypothetical protein